MSIASAIAPLRVGPKAIPMLIATIKVDIVEPIPNLLPSSTVMAVAVGVEIASLRARGKHSHNCYQKVLVRGIKVRVVR